MKDFLFKFKLSQPRLLVLWIIKELFMLFCKFIPDFYGRRNKKRLKDDFVEIRKLIELVGSWLKITKSKLNKWHKFFIIINLTKICLSLCMSNYTIVLFQRDFKKTTWLSWNINELHQAQGSGKHCYANDFLTWLKLLQLSIFSFRKFFLIFEHSS